MNSVDKQNIICYYVTVIAQISQFNQEVMK